MPEVSLSSILNPSPAPTGLETDGEILPQIAEVASPSLFIRFKSQHLRLIQITLLDQSDSHNELVQENEWLLHPSDRRLTLQGNLFVVEDVFTGCGKVFIKHAPLPHSRPLPLPFDLKLTVPEPTGFTLEFTELPDAKERTWVVLEYTGGITGRTATLQNWQQALRPHTDAHRVPRFLSNTWGDRSRDSNICEAFILQEIEAAKILGVEVLQIDDGWEKGMSANSAYAKAGEGTWQGYWKTDPDFWTPHPTRFPRGLGPVVQAVKNAGMELGLWFGPDSYDNFANWQRDADCLLGLYRTHGIAFFKLDSVCAQTPLATENLQRFYRTVLEESNQAIVMDFDITAQIRPGYFGAIRPGPLFVENRYTDFHSYWPHQTLRALWKLSRWIHPARLRMEFLNNTRHTERYPEDPLAPACYTPDALFASIMCSNPLGWFECSNLPQSYFESILPLSQLWKQHREALFAGAIHPIGRTPDGLVWTGFLSLAPDEQSGYLMLYREMNPSSNWRVPLDQFTHLDVTKMQYEILAGDGRVSVDAASLNVTIAKQLSYLWVQFKL